jgi:hypothetical protein
MNYRNSGHHAAHRHHFLWEVGVAATDSPDSTTRTREAEELAPMTGGRFERPGEVVATPTGTTSGTSVAAIVLGILGIIGGLFIPLIGLVLGITGLVLARRIGGPVANRDRTGMYLCIAAIVVSVVNWIATVIIVTS